MPNTNVFRSAFETPQDGSTGLGKRPVVLDIVGPDRRTSLLPDDLKMVLHVNPKSMSIAYTNRIEVIQTKGGFVEQHWGAEPTQLSFEQSTGAFARLQVGVTSVTGPGPFNDLVRPFSTQAGSLGGTRRESIAYDKYLDMLAIYYNNGAIYDIKGQVAYQGQIKVTFDGDVYYGWFTSFSVSEDVDSPFQFSLSAGFTVEREIHHLRSTRTFPGDFAYLPAQTSPQQGT